VLVLPQAAPLYTSTGGNNSQSLISLPKKLFHSSLAGNNPDNKGDKQLRIMLPADLQNNNSGNIANLTSPTAGTVGLTDSPPGGQGIHESSGKEEKASIGLNQNSSVENPLQGFSGGSLNHHYPQQKHYHQ
jgi:hypothetical protein